MKTLTIELNKDYTFEYDATKDDETRAIYWVIDNNYFGDNKKICLEIMQDWNVKADKKWIETLNSKTRTQAILEIITELDLYANNGFLKFYAEDIEEDIKENAEWN